MSRLTRLLSVAALAGCVMTLSGLAHADGRRNGGPQWWHYNQGRGYQHDDRGGFEWPGRRYFNDRGYGHYGFQRPPYGGWQSYHRYRYPEFHRFDRPYRNWDGQNWRYGW